MRSRQAQDVADPAAVQDALLDAGGRLEMTAVGNSMGSAYAWVESVVVERPSKAPIALGCIAVYARGDEQVAHRVVWRWCAQGLWSYALWGDGAAWPDPERVAHEDVIGVVTQLRGADRTLDLKSPGCRCCARGRVVRTLAAGLLRHPRVVLRRLLSPEGV